MRAIFLTTSDLMDLHWWAVVNLIDPVVNQAARGEFTLEDITRLVQDRHAIAGLAMDGNTPVMGMVFEFKTYPSKTVINIIALGGHNLQEVATSFWPDFVSWAGESGATEIEACTSPAMTRMLKKMGFVHTYDVVRFPIGERT